MTEMKPTFWKFFLSLVISLKIKARRNWFKLNVQWKNLRFYFSPALTVMMRNLKRRCDYLLCSLVSDVLQLQGVEALLLCQRSHHLSPGCSHFLQNRHHTGQLTPALLQRLRHLMDDASKTVLLYTFKKASVTSSGWWSSFVFLHLWPEAEGSRDSSNVCSRHTAANLLTELSDVWAGSVQVLQEDGEAWALLSWCQERPQACHLYPHAVQGSLGELR